MRKDQHKIKQLENQLDKANVIFNDLQAQNKNLRQEIDVWRKQQRNQNRVNSGLTAEITQTIKKVKELNNFTYQGQRLSEETNNQILALKAKHEADKLNFEDKIQSLQTKLRERDESELDHKAKGATDDKTTKDSGELFSNPAALLKPRLNRWKANNIEKKALMDLYTRNVSIIKDAFETIKAETGISSNDEIVTTFVKAEEQNYSLYNYVNTLNSEIDMIDETNKNIKAEIERHEKLSKMSDTEKTAARLNLQKEIEEMRAKNMQKEAQISNIEEQMVTIKNHVWNMVEKFGASHFTLAVANHMHYDEEVVFNENNVTLYLSELEEYISNFITYLATKDRQPDAPIAGLSLENMNNKEFDKGVISIEAPNAHEWPAAGDETNTEAEEIVINPRDLYRKYEELANKGLLIP